MATIADLRDGPWVLLLLVGWFAPDRDALTAEHDVSGVNYNHVILAANGRVPRGLRPAYVRPSVANGGVDASNSSAEHMTTGADPLDGRRLEIVDDGGVTRAVVGLLDGVDGATSDRYGLSLRGADGAERVALSVDADGPTLVFVHKGNIVVQVGVDESLLPDDHVGAFVTIADTQGVPIVQVLADPDGSLQVERGPGSPSPG